jgi:hypothetical protein
MCFLCIADLSSPFIHGNGLFLRILVFITECFNNFFSTVASSIGKDVNYDPLQHLSIVEIKRKMEIESEKSFVFQKVQQIDVLTMLNLV